MTLIFNPLQALAMIYSQSNVQGQRLVGSEDRVQTDRRTEVTALPNSLMRSVITKVSKADQSAKLLAKEVPGKHKAKLVSILILVAS